MEGSAKIAIGMAATALLAWGNHSLAGAGERFAGSLKAKAEKAVAVPEGGTQPSISFAGQDGGGALSRYAIVSGPHDEADKAGILASIRRIPGVSGAAWAKDPAADMAASDATTGEVAACQDNIDKLAGSESITFRDGSAYVNPALNGEFLDKVAAELKTCKDARIEVSGHTNTTGSASINRSMSQARAEAVMAELVTRGVPETSLTAKGYGADRLKNEADGTAAENRRIEFEVSAASAKPANEDIGA